MTELKNTVQTWDLRYLDLALMIASWSKDPSTKVGCIIVDRERRPMSWGYNGFPKGIPDHEEFLNNREQKYKCVIHAEQNAILFSRTSDLMGCTVYITHCPCSQCAASLIQLKVSRVVTFVQPDFELRWAESLTVTKDLLDSAKIQYIAYTKLNVIK